MVDQNDAVAAVTVLPCPTKRRLNRIGPNSRAPSAASNTPRRRTYRGTSRRTVASTPNQPKSAFTAARRTSACPPWRCTCSRTSSPTAAAFAARCSRDLGYCRVTYVVTPARSRTDAPTAARRLPIVRIYGRTCRRTRPTRITSARDVTRPSPSSPIWTNT